MRSNYIHSSCLKIQISILLTISWLLSGCCSSELVNLSDTKNALIAYHESGKYDKEVYEVIRDAKEKFDNIGFTASSVVIFDIDETALLNYSADKEVDFGYAETLFDEWINKAQAPAVKPVKELYDYLLQRNCKIIFLTGRRLDQYPATEKNLKNQGYSVYDTLITRIPAEKDLKAIDYKTAKRKELAAKGYEIAGTVGDQWSDLKGEPHGIQVKIPNYIYKVD